MDIIFSLIIILNVCVVVLSILVGKNFKKISEEYKELESKYSLLQMQYDCSVSESIVFKKEIKQLKEELDAERKVAKSNNVKKVEDLPKTEKVSKPRTRKTTKK